MSMFSFQPHRSRLLWDRKMIFLRRAWRKWCCHFISLTTRVVCIKVADSFANKPCLAAVTRIIARRGYPSTIISGNGTNFVGAAKELKVILDKRLNAMIEIDLKQKNPVWKFNHLGAPKVGRTRERLVKNCKKIKIAALINRNFTGELLSTTMYLVEQTLNARPLTAVSDNREHLTAVNRYVLRQPASSTTTWENPSKRLKHMPTSSGKIDSWMSSTMERNIEMAKRGCANTERRRTCFYGRWFSETIWMLKWTSYPSLQMRRWRRTISESQIGTLWFQHTGSEIGASILRWCFRDQKQVGLCWRYFISASAAVRKREISFEIEKLRICQNSKMVKTEKFYNLGPITCTPISILGRNNLSNARI